MVARASRAFEVGIVLDPEILAGKPVIRGTRIPVALVLDYLANTPTLMSCWPTIHVLRWTM